MQNYLIPKINIPHGLDLSIDVGCGANKKKDIGIDIEDHGQEIVWDIRNGIPLPDSSCKEIYTCHTLEHIEDKYMWMIFKEFYRIGKNDCEITIRVPHVNSVESMIVSHVSYWSEKRIMGILKGLSDANENWFKLEDMRQLGIELFVTLRVQK